MQNKAWNQYSSDSDVEDNDNDSWFDDDKKENTKGAHNGSNNETTQQPSKVEETAGQTSGTESKTEKAKPRTDENEKKKTYLTDEELLNLYLNKQVDNPRAIKATNVRSEQIRQIIRDTKTRKTVQINQNAFILFFETEEELVNFVKQKIEKRSRYYLQQFFQNRKNDREDRYKNRDQNNNERRPRREENLREPRRDRVERREKGDSAVEQKKETQERRPKKRYQKQQDSEKQEKKQSRQYDERKQKKTSEKQEQKSKKVYLPKQYFEIPQKSNNLIITSDNFEVERVLEELQKKRVVKDFGRFYIEAPFSTLKKVSFLCQEIGKRKKFYLEKEPPLQAEKQSIVKLTMIENLKKHQTDTFVQRFKPKVQEPVESHLRLLADKPEDYFKNLDKYNVSEIVKGFDENKYITLLREASQNIQKLWNCWKIQAEEDNIEVLLRLTNRIKKSTIYDLELRPSLRNEKALLVAELKERPQKERRPKVDVSNVNNYLS